MHRTPVECPSDVWSAVVDVVVAHPPAVAASEWEAEKHLRDFRVAQKLEAARDSGDPLASVAFEQSTGLIRAAEEVALWYPAAVDAIVERRLGPVTFTAVATQVAAAIAASGQRALQALTPASDLVQRDIQHVLAEFRRSPNPHPMDLLEGR